MIDDRPERPWRSFDAYLRSPLVHRPWGLPCTRCDGASTIIKPGERPCPIEGHKMSERITCPLCEGSRLGDIAAHRKRYEYWIGEWKAKFAKWRVRDAARRKALAKLTADDRRALGL